MEKIVKPIDFSTFKKGDRYNIIIKRSGRIFNARIGHFRKGIAIAYDNYPFLINVKCEIIYIPPEAYSGRHRNTTIDMDEHGNYIVRSEHDISAPGKDRFFQDSYIDAIIDENGLLPNGNSALSGEIFEYPMSVPYERGKFIYLKNCFYDLETLKIVCTCPNNTTFCVDSEVENNSCEIHDEKFNRKILVNVKNGIIINQTDITSIYDIIEERYNYGKQLISDFLYMQNKCFIEKLRKYIRDIPPKNLYSVSILEELISDFNRTGYFELDSMHRKDYFSDIKLSRCKKVYYLLQSDFNKIYLYNKKGELLCKTPFAQITPIPDKFNLFPNSDIFTFQEINNAGGIMTIKDQHFIEKRYFSEKNIRKVAFTDRNDTSNTSFYDNYNYCCYRNYDNTSFYNLKFEKLETVKTNDIQVETIIKNYYYKIQNGSAYQKNSLFDSISLFPYMVEDKVYIPTKEAENKAYQFIKAELEKGNPYVMDIEYCKLFNYQKKMDAESYIFNYQPYGKMYMDGKIIYPLPPEVTKL